MSRVTRRRFIKTSLGSASGLWLSGFPLASSWSQDSWAAAVADPHSPFGVVTDPKSLQGFSGDQFERPHSILWKKPEYLASKGGIPAATEKASVVVIGGGIAGMTAAYRLRDLKPILLEQAPAFGGNAKGEAWGDLRYGLGAAYFNEPELGTPSGDLLKELGLLNRARHEQLTDASVLTGGKIAKDFWERPGHREVRAKLLTVRAQGFPEIPAMGAAVTLSREALNALDRVDFSTWYHKNLGDIPPMMEEFLNEYCWSSFSAGAEELSAAQALNFLFSDMEGIHAFPGGNAAISEALYKKLKATLPSAHLRPGCIAAEVAVDSSGVRVTYENAAGKLVSIQAKACVMATAKFICGKVISGLLDDQRAAIAKLKYRAYVVANVLLKHKIRSPSYDLFRLEGRPNLNQDLFAESSGRAYTDAVFGAWAAGDRPEHSAITLYKALPYDGGRGGLYAPSAFGEAMHKFESAVPELLASIGVAPLEVAAIRLSRWGHALPVAAKGLIAEGTLELASRAVGGRLFFGQQDNWASPCFESAVKAGYSAAESARRAAVHGVKV